jgi:hypothetical protein
MRNTCVRRSAITRSKAPERSSESRVAIFLLSQAVYTSSVSSSNAVSDDLFRRNPIYESGKSEYFSAATCRRTAVAASIILPIVFNSAIGL